MTNQKDTSGDLKLVESTKPAPTPYIKRLDYEEVKIITLGGVLKIVRQESGSWCVAFEQHAAHPTRSYGGSIMEAGKSVVNDLRRIATAIEEDLQAFAERNK